MAADLNIDVRCSILGSITGSDNNVPWIKRFAESFGTKYTQGTDVTASQAEHIAYDTISVTAGGSTTLDVRALAGADGRTYLFTSVSLWFFSFDDTTANDNLHIYGDGIVSTLSTTMIKTATGSPVLQILPGGFFVNCTGPSDQFLPLAGTESFTMDNTASSPAASNVTYLVMGIGSIT